MSSAMHCEQLEILFGAAPAIERLASRLERQRRDDAARARRRIERDRKARLRRVVRWAACCSRLYHYSAAGIPWADCLTCRRPLAYGDGIPTVAAVVRS